MKRFLALVMVVVMLLSLTACGNGDEKTANSCRNCAAPLSDTDAFCSSCGSEVGADTTNVPVNTEQGTTVGEIDEGSTENTEALSGTPAYADVEKMKSDLIAEEGNCFIINNEITYLNVDSIEILKRKSDAEYDEVHIAVALSNAYYAVNAEYILFYSYYNVGGWCWDGSMLVESQIRAIASPVSDSDFIAFMQNHFSSCEITDRTQGADSTGVYNDVVNFTATIDYDYLSIRFSGFYSAQFYDDCWHDGFDFWIDDYDWSAFEDTFRYRSQSINLGAGFYSADVKISLSNIEQISDEWLSVTYSASVYLYDKTSDFVEENEEIAEETRQLRISTERITILGQEIEVPRRATYISLPWYGTFAVYLCRDNGVEATDDTAYGHTFAHFDRVVSDEDLQDAMDRLEKLNP